MCRVFIQPFRYYFPSIHQIRHRVRAGWKQLNLTRVGLLLLLRFASRTTHTFGVRGFVINQAKSRRGAIQSDKIHGLAQFLSYS